MTRLLQSLAAHRRRIKLARVAEAAAKGAFTASLAGCVALAVCKIGGLTSAAAPILIALGLVPLALAARAAVRPFTVRDCAVHLDRTLGLDERLSTAVEFAGAMSGAQESDAASALASATLPPRRLPREGKLLAGSGLLLLVLMAIPAPELARAAGDVAHKEFVVDEVAKLEALGDVDIEFREVAALLEEGRPEEALEKLEALRRKLLERVLDGKGGARGAEQALKTAAATARAITAELARLGRPVHASAPSTVRLKLERQALDAPEDAISNRAVPDPVRRGVRVDDDDWHPRYDPVIRNYFRLRSRP